MEDKRPKYVTVSLPIAFGDAIDSLIEELGYWPSRGAFVREACLEKIRDEERRLRELREAEEAGKSKGVGDPQDDDSSPNRGEGFP